MISTFHWDVLKLALLQTCFGIIILLNYLFIWRLNQNGLFILASIVLCCHTAITHTAITAQWLQGHSTAVYFFFFLFLILPGCSFKCYHLFSHEAQGRNVPNSLTVGMGFHCSYVPSGTFKQWKVAFLILINTSAPIKFRILEMETD